MSKQEINHSESETNKYSALINNTNAVRAIASSVEGTIGPKGLDTMLVDQFGEVIITNDGVTILNLMDVNHPAAKMMINIAKAQQSEIGDGTTTATIMAGSLVSEGTNQVIKGVPVARVIEGLKAGIKKALEIIKEKSMTISGLDDPLLLDVALIAGRENHDIAHLIIEAAKLVGIEKLREPYFRLADHISSIENAENEVFSGVLINKEPMNFQMPKELSQVKILIVDDALEPEKIEEEALRTEAGFQKYLELQREFKENVEKIIELGVKLVLVDRGVNDLAEEILSDAGVMVVQRVSNKELKKLSEHTGAKMIKRTGLRKTLNELSKIVGEAENCIYNQKLEHVRIIGGKQMAVATVVVGASTEEVVGERQRIAKDAASAVQAAVKGGVVPGGGTLELAVSRQVDQSKQDMRGMASFGVECVVMALKKPFAQIVANAGFNPLEKMGDVTVAQVEQQKDSLGINCDTGDVIDMFDIGVVDPALVKLHAIKAAGEVAEAILRIDTIIKKREIKNMDTMDI